MIQHDYILSSSNLPFDLGSLEPEADLLFAAVPTQLMNDLNNGGHHSDSVHVGDLVSAWIANNWRTVLPVLSTQFPAK